MRISTLAHRMPTHPTKVHPHTGKPLRAIYVRRDGRVFWPIIGAAPDEPTPEEKAAAEKAAADKAAADKKAADDKAAAEKAAGGNAVDGEGKDLGYPKDTPWTDMNDKQQAAYWRHNSRKHENQNKQLLGDRTPEQVKKDLEELAELKKAQQTPAEQALTAAREEGKAEALKTERTNTATAIFRSTLETAGIKGDDLEEFVDAFNPAKFIGDSGVETTKITNFAKKLTPGKGNNGGSGPDYGGGRGGGTGGGGARGSAGKAEAERRGFIKTKSGE